MDTNEYRSTILGVEGRMFNRVPWPADAGHRGAGLLANQAWVASRPIKYDGENCVISVDLRFDDNCRNGHQTFSITGSIRAPRRSRGDDGYRMGGCIHDEIAKHFPELAPLIRWHLCSTDGPMHYLANTIYHAGDRDHNRLRAGERRQIRNGRTKQLAWRLAYVDENGNEVPEPERYRDSDTRPQCNVSLAYLPWETIGEGKERQLDFARNSACWPEATDEQLMAEPDVLRDALLARLPGLLEDFQRAMVDTCGFEWREHTVESRDELAKRGVS